MQAQDFATQRTKQCIQSIKARDGPKVPLTLVVGRAWVGKSSLTECITGVTGLSGSELDPVTERCQVVDFRINNTQRAIIDTPGLENTESWRHTFHGIVDILNELRDHAFLSGVWFVVSNVARRAGDFEQKLYRWLAAFCGEEFFPYLTFVTTFWETQHAKQLNSYNRNLRVRLSEDWAGFISLGARHHQFGKRYVGGIEQEETLSWYGQQEELAAQARDMVTWYCSDTPTAEPRIVRELKDNRPIGLTAAAQVFEANSYRSTAGDGTNPQHTRQSNQSSSSRTGPSRQAEHPGPEGSYRGAGPSSAQPDNSSSIGRRGEVLASIVNIAKQNPGLAAKVGSGIFNYFFPLSASAGLDFGVFESRGLDFYSVEDTCKALKLPSDLGSRSGFFESIFGTGDYVGSAEQNDILRKALMRNFGG